ncbi:MAG: hypothetical protein J5705_01655 [Bacteroidaceae bacterium]|nr:hypothetical protein [Bacteroidaceae bacterium]
MKQLALLTCLLMTVLSVDCTHQPSIADVLDSAGPNRSELEAVLSHYKTNDNNPQKLQAAEFLIKNMPAHYSYAGDAIYEYYEYAAGILADKSLSQEQQRDSLLSITDLKYRDLPDHTVSDAQVIKADFLIKNIDTSYDRWVNCDWARQITFDEYLEWLLPYKAIELQELDAWRDTLLAHFGKGLEHPIKNDVEYNTTMATADMLRNDAYNGLNRYGLYTRAGLPLLSAHLQAAQTYGDIPDYALTAVLVFRSAGIPAVWDETPVGSRGTAATRWYTIISDRGEHLNSEWDFATMIGGSFFPYERGPKVYRSTYAINPERWEYRQKAKYQYPFELGRKDVTSQYFLVSDIAIPIEKGIRKQIKDKYVYIASAVRSEEKPWQIVDFGVIKHGKATFHDMGREVLYQIQGYNGETLIPISEPFILHKDGSIEYVSADALNSTNLDKWKNNAI